MVLARGSARGYPATKSWPVEDFESSTEGEEMGKTDYGTIYAYYSRRYIFAFLKTTALSVVSAIIVWLLTDDRYLGASVFYWLTAIGCAYGLFYSWTLDKFRSALAFCSVSLPLAALISCGLHILLLDFAGKYQGWECDGTNLIHALKTRPDCPAALRPQEK